MLAFQEQDAEFFFGREMFVDGLVGVVHQQPLVTVIGSSGSGKSSVVLAGLIPKLREAGNWLIESFRPNKQPFYELAAALISQLEPELGKTDKTIKAKELAESIRQHGFTADVSAILKDNPGKRLLLVVDQFEELYTGCADTEQQQFVDALLAAVESASARLRLVLTLRADFYSYVVNYSSFGEALNKYPAQNISLMKAQEMQAAIELPAQKMGVKLEEGLTQRILDDVRQEPGNLPLLEFALTQLWEKQSRGRLTHQAYSEIGGVAKALSNHAEAVYDKLSEGEQKQAQRIFLQLVRPGEGTEDTRRVATRGEVGEECWELIRRTNGLADARLVVTGRNEATGEESVEVVHEALIREWGKLQEWIENDRTFLTWRVQLRIQMAQWNADKDEGALLRGKSLVIAEDWRNRRLDELSPKERVFIQLSLARQRRRTLGLVSVLIIIPALALLAQKQLGEWVAEHAHDNLAKQIAKVSPVPKTEDVPIKSLFVTDDAVWMDLYDSDGQAKGLMRYDRKTDNIQPYLAKHRVTALLVEGKEIWVGVEDQGVQDRFFVQHRIFQDGHLTLTEEPWLVGAKVTSLVRDQQNRLWVGTGDGICQQKSQQCQPINDIQVLCPSGGSPPLKLRVTQMKLDIKQSTLWIATNRGLVRWHLEGKKELSECNWDKQQSKSEETPYSLTTVDLDKSGHPWVGTIRGQVKRLGGNVGTLAWDDDVPDKVASGTLSDLAALPDGFFLAGSLNGGLFLYSPATNTWKEVFLTGNLRLRVYDIFLGADDRLWLATEEGLYTSNQPIQFRKKIVKIAFRLL